MSYLKEFVETELIRGNFTDDDGSLDLVLYHLRKNNIKINPKTLKEINSMRAYRSKYLLEHPEYDKRIKYAPRLGKILKVHANQTTFKFNDDQPYKQQPSLF